MRHALTAALFAGSICALSAAAPAMAQTASDSYGYGFGPVGQVVAAPFTVAGAVISAPFGAGGGPTIASQTGAPAYSYDTIPPSWALNGHCDIISGNHVCFAGP